MDKKLYNRGLIGQCWYNSTEALAYALQYRPKPDELTYEPRVAYGSGKLNYINFYYPNGKKKEKKPLFLYIHGGGWISGITDMRNMYISNWARLGFITASVSYTYAPQKVFPAQLNEVFSAVDFLFDHAEEYGIDTDNIVISGESAGGYFIAYLAAVAADPSICEKAGFEFRHRNEFKIRAMVSHAGCYNLKRLADRTKEQASFPDIKMMISSFLGIPYKNIPQWLDSEEGRYASPAVSKDFPPTFVTWSTMDKLRFEAFDFMKELKECGVPYEEFRGDGIISPHAWTIATTFKKSRICFEKSKDFVLPYLPDYFG